MPCYDPRDKVERAERDSDLLQLVARCATQTLLLCEICKSMREEDMSEDLHKWWQDHKTSEGHES